MRHSGLVQMPHIIQFMAAVFERIAVRSGDPVVRARSVFVDGPDRIKIAIRLLRSGEERDQGVEVMV
ncbi:hypothetical protein D3C87_2065700 [compost metagenome]